MSSKQNSSGTQDNLNFEQAKEMTIEEAVRKEAEIKAGITENDSILDKYIKQNREEVNSQKFENTRELSELSRAKIDQFIAEQRDELSQVKTPDTDSKDLSVESETINVAVEVPENHSFNTIDKFDDVEAMDGKIGLGETETSQPNFKKKGLWLGVATALIIGGSALGYGLLQGNPTIKSTETTTQSSEMTESIKESSSKDQKNLQAFNEKYITFFSDEGQSKLKNSEFGKLSELENMLKSLEGSEYYDDAKSKFERLSKSIKAVQAVNDKFDTPAIVDGEKVNANLKANMNLDDLSATTLNTGNAQLDTLLQAVVAEARSNVTPSEGNSQTKQSTDNTIGEKSPTVAEPSNASATSESKPTGSEVSATSSYGITNYDVKTLQRHLSRVPYNFDLIADTSNSAWSFNEGILEKIVATAQERGHITGNNYILEKVNIVNGNGYYNMFKPDGTYLFSINCKTGYFVGNARGNADALDY